MLGTTLRKRFNEAAEMSVKQTELFNQLSAMFSPETVNKWEEKVAKWNMNPKAPNPYQEPKSRKLYFSNFSIFVTNTVYRNNSPRCSSSVSDGRGCPSRHRRASATQNQPIVIPDDRL